MSTMQKLPLFLLRIALGWMFLYAGIKHLLDPKFSAAGYIQNAATFHGFYQVLLSGRILPTINFLNEWGLTLLGASLLLGFLVRWSGIFGAVLMLLYYFPVLVFPYIKPNSYLVDDHIIFALALLVLAVFGAGRYWGLDRR